MKRSAAGIAGLFALFLIWETAALAAEHPLLPPPHRIILEAEAGPLLYHTAASLGRIGIGSTLALLIGVPAGVAAARSRRAGAWINSLSWLLYPVPKVLFLPVLLLFFGLGDLSKVLLICFSLLFFILVSVRDRILELPESYYSCIQSFGGRRRDAFRFVSLPALLPGLFSSLRIGISIAGGVLFFAENFGSSSGIGWFIIDAKVRVDYLELYQGILSLGLSLSLLLALLFLAQRLISPWSSRE